MFFPLQNKCFQANLLYFEIKLVVGTVRGVVLNSSIGFVTFVVYLVCKNFNRLCGLTYDTSSGVCQPQAAGGCRHQTVTSEYFNNVPTVFSIECQQEQANFFAIIE